MTEEVVIDIARNTIWIIIKSAAPMLLVSLIIGLIISIFQTVTSIQEQTLTFVPKLLGIFLVLMLVGHWIMGNITSFTQELFNNFSAYIS